MCSAGAAHTSNDNDDIRTEPKQINVNDTASHLVGCRSHACTDVIVVAGLRKAAATAANLAAHIG